MKIELTTNSFTELSDRFLQGVGFSEMVLTFQHIDDPDGITSGQEVELWVTISEIKKTINLSGKVRWKRSKDIKTPFRVMPAGVGIVLDEKSVEILKKTESMSNGLSDIDEPMLAGNYIKIRKDIAAKYRSKKREPEKVGSEKRAQPRMTMSLSVEIFLNNEVKRWKTRDLSLDGMLVVTSEEIPLQTEIIVVFNDDATGRQFFIRGEIVRTVRDGKGELAAGIRFLYDSQDQRRDLMKFMVRRS